MMNTTESAAGETPAFIPVASPGEGPISVRDAGRALASFRHELRRKREADPDPQASLQGSAPRAEETSAVPQEPEPESADADAAPPEELAPEKLASEEARGEAETADPEAAALPPIEPPRSWTKDDKELFSSLPRATQERIAERERLREGDFLRRQNEAAELRKAMDAERGQVELARQQYEAALPALLQTLQQQQAGEFADIKTIADVEKLAREDFSRYALWDAQQKKIGAVLQELNAVQARQVQERQILWSEFARRQDDLFKEKVPEFADGEKAAKLQNAAVGVLKDLGFHEGELLALWNGQRGISLRDHRLQLLVRDGIRYREAQQKARLAATKPVPPVQRPGVAQPKGAARDAQLQALTTKLEKTGSLKDAARLLAERRKAAR
jgi:hypothetical protein